MPRTWTLLTAAAAVAAAASFTVACNAAPEEAASEASPAAEPAATAAAEASPGGVPAAEPWGRALKAAQEDGGLRYAALKAEPEDLDAYLATLPGADLTAASREQKIAFWINAYNALVAQGVVERYPQLESVIKVEGFFDGERHRIAGEELTLNEIEQKALDLDEPRVHFAVVCASTGCPDLRAEPFQAPFLERQLAEQTSRFLADEEKGLRYDAEANELWLSKIFEWYGDDFGGDPIAWLLTRLPEDLAKKLQEAKPQVKFLEYDWSLNDRS